MNKRQKIELIKRNIENIPINTYETDLIDLMGYSQFETLKCEGLKYDI